ncbi:MAG: NADP-dependent oxidoreductase, partial [Luminiphilus sp.]|nr:NADP-dependent oxidoreductase [Luminiphilus sp.]
MTINRQWLLDNRPVGMIGPEHFKYVETTIPEPGDGEVLIRNLMFSF